MTEISLSGESLKSVEKLQAAYSDIRGQMSQVIVGQDEVIEQLLIALFSRGHCILEGVPGLAKTLMISTLARCLSMTFSRIQFTPDLMPADITGTEVLEENRTTGKREFRFLEGPLFYNVILADEINRTPPKTQAALLEAMQERQVTVGRVRHTLTDPFFVLATQNPDRAGRDLRPARSAAGPLHVQGLREVSQLSRRVQIAKRTTALATDEHSSHALECGRDSSTCRTSSARFLSPIMWSNTRWRSSARRAWARRASLRSSASG